MSCYISTSKKDKDMTKQVSKKSASSNAEVKALQREVQRLKLALADATLERDALESLLEVANEYYGVDMTTLKKTSSPCNPALFRK
ncbi:MAG: hypothetical protein LBQ28_03805 [Prevotellaceae bacterium]|jgi:predicted RNase H-like nuclease (RuvC/YqgF family)|nr:hypothetical protein [Prevotellaceae bacterium]